jgi:CheY-like chemotaxis protein
MTPFRARSAPSPADFREVRYEIALLEDDPETRALLEQELTRRGITVHAYGRGEEVLQKLVGDAGIGAFLTDIEILEHFPDGDFARLQGYDVANRLLEEASNRLLSVVVMTRLPVEEAFDSLNSFRLPITTFHKGKWSREDARAEAAFDELADLLKKTIESTPHTILEELQRDYPSSRWLSRGYWPVYRSLWLSRDWPRTETAVGARAAEIVQGYRSGDLRGQSLRSGILSFSERPTAAQLPDHLIGRRVIYALKLLEPADWDRLVTGERVVEETRAISLELWNAIQTDRVRALINTLSRRMSDHDLGGLHDRFESLSAADRQLYMREKAAAQPIVEQLGQALSDEPEEVRQGLVPYLWFWDLDFRRVPWKFDPAAAGRDEQNLKQVLILLGVRREDIRDDNPANWKLLLPEERSWLHRLVGTPGNATRG